MASKHEATKCAGSCTNAVHSTKPVFLQSTSAAIALKLANAIVLHKLWPRVILKQACGPALMDNKVASFLQLHICNLPIQCGDIALH